MNNYIDEAKILWDYHHLNQNITKSDCILAFGSHDTHVAERAAELFNQGYADYIIFTGGLGRITQTIWSKPEAEKFYDIATALGVPTENIFVENQSTNTGENIKFTKELIKNKSLNFNNFIVVDKPFKERRIYATLKKQWSNLQFVVTSPQNTFEEYCDYYHNSGTLNIDSFINIMVGDLQRIDVYGKNGFQIPQEIPNFVYQAYKKLIQLGYSEQLLNDF